MTHSPSQLNTLRRPHALQSASILLGGVALCVVGLVSVGAGLFVDDSLRPLTIGLVVWLIAAGRGMFHLHITRDDLFMLAPIVSSALTGIGLVAVGELALLQSRPDMGQLVTHTFLVVLGLVVGLQVGRRVLLSLWRRGEFRTSAIVVGDGEISRQLMLELTHRPDLGIDVLDHIVLTGEEADSDVIVDAVGMFAPDRLIVGEVANEEPLLRSLRVAGTAGTRVYVLPRLFEMGLGNPLFTPDRLRGFPLLRANRAAHPQLSFALKRVFDVAAASFALFIASPVIALAAIAVRVTSPGPILFWQERIGQHGVAFSVPKLRSMSGGETGDTDWTAEARITPVGRLIRRTAIDELPQLWTVIRGDMSLVGPRPERPAFVEQFSSEHPRYADRLRMRAGLTGLSQIAGLRGDTSIAERAKYDNLYIDQWSLTGDLIILLRTVIAIVREGTYAQAHIDLEAVIRLDEDALDMSADSDGGPVDLRPTTTNTRATA